MNLCVSWMRHYKNWLAKISDDSILSNDVRQLAKQWYEFGVFKEKLKILLYNNNKERKFGWKDRTKYILITNYRALKPYGFNPISKIVEELL